jgi:transposase InsO family protein
LQLQRIDNTGENRRHKYSMVHRMAAADTHELATSHPRQRYDYRIREAICETGDRDLFPELNIPRSTIRSWIHRGVPDVVTCDLAVGDRSDLVVEIRELRHRAALLGAVIGLLIAMLRVSKVNFEYERLPDGDSKATLLRSIERASRILPLHSALRIARLSSSRYHRWCREVEGCDLNDRPSCPRVVPTRLTPEETEAMRKMVESVDHRHMSLRGLALHAQRIGSVFASPSTWYSLAQKSGWRRPRNRVYPAKPKVGIRANAPGEVLHLDVTIIKLLDGTRAYLHAVIDNYSRRILSWTLEDRLGSGATCRVLRQAARQVVAISEASTVVVDSGSENVNREVDDLLESVDLTRVLAQVEVTFSNSMIEAFWRSLKHAWIFLHPLDNMASLRRLIEFYVTSHNEVMPHAAFEGQTPDEMFFGTGGGVTVELAALRKAAREERMKTNRLARCGVCVGESDSAMLQVQRL